MGEKERVGREAEIENADGKFRPAPPGVGSSAVKASWDGELILFWERADDPLTRRTISKKVSIVGLTLLGGMVVSAWVSSDRSLAPCWLQARVHLQH